jgi:hypothetical protein
MLDPDRIRFNGPCPMCRRDPCPTPVACHVELEKNAQRELRRLMGDPKEPRVGPKHD